MNKAKGYVSSKSPLDIKGLHFGNNITKGG
jgi:hypothetical protein